MKLIPNLPIGSILKRLKFRKSSAEQFEGSQEASLKEESKIKKLIPKPSIGGIMNRLKSKIPLLKQKPEPETPPQRPPSQPTTPPQRPPSQPTTPPQRPPSQPTTPPQRPPTGQAPPPPAAYEPMPEPMSEEGSRIAKLIPKPSIGGIMNRLKFKKPSFGKKSASELFEPQAEAQPKKRFGITKKRLVIIVPILILVAVVATGQTPFGINTQGIIDSITQPSQSSSIQMQIANQDLINRIGQLEAEIGFVLDGDFSGAQGPEGKTGLQGLRGMPGPTGDVAPIPIMLSSGPLVGIPHDVFVGQGVTSSNYLAARVLLPYGGTIKDLHVVASDVPGIGINVVFVKNGFETTLFCELDSLTSSCSDTKSFVNVEPGDTVAVKIKKSLPLEVPNFSIQASVILKQPGS